MTFSSKPTCSRRNFLSGASTLSLCAVATSAFGATTSEHENLAFEDAQLAVIPQDTLLKFYLDGRLRPFAGNTIICHLPQQSRTRNAISELGDALRSASFTSKLGVLPADSYHVTILGGVNDQDRKRYGWPSDIPLDAPIEKANAVIAQRLSNYRIHRDLPLRFVIDSERTRAPQRASGLHLVPADEHEAEKIRLLRDSLAADVFKYRADNHANVGFHISLAYQLQPFTVAERREYQTMIEMHSAKIVATADVIELGIPEFCTFADMSRFEFRNFLRT